MRSQSKCLVYKVCLFQTNLQTAKEHLHIDCLDLALHVYIECFWLNAKCYLKLALMQWFALACRSSKFEVVKTKTMMGHYIEEVVL